MARFPLLASVFLLTLSASFRRAEGGCYQNGAISMCQIGTRIAQTIYIDTNMTVAGNEECSCQITRSAGGEVEIGAIDAFGSPSNCGPRVEIDMNGEPLHEINCYTDQAVIRPIPSNSPIELKLKGPGKLNACFFISTLTQGFTNDDLTITCSNKVQVATTLTPPSTTTQQPPPTTTQQPGPTTTQQPEPTSSQQPEPTSSQQPGPTSTQQPGPTSTQQPGPTSTQQPGPTTTQQPGPTTTQQPGPTTTQQPGPTTTQQPEQSTPSTTPQPAGTTQAVSAGSTAGFDTFPVAEVAGGVAGGILLMILLVICITCCTSGSKKRQADEESLKSHASQSPMPEMQENKEGYAFDNLLYHASHRDESGKDGKSLTPTVSEGSTHDEAAIKGFEELYASVNKNITDSTDIM